MKPYDVDKLHKQPVVREPQWINPESDPGPGQARGYVVVAVGTPNHLDTIFFDATLGYFVVGPVATIATQQVLAYDESTGVLTGIVDADGSPVYGYAE